MIKIKKLDGTTRCETEINENSLRHVELMKEDYITLKFSLQEPCIFELGDYINFADFATEYPLLAYLGRFEVIDTADTLPTFNATTAGYDYSIKLEAYYRKWQNKILKFCPGVTGSESSWTITDTILNIGVIIAQNLKSLGYTYYGTTSDTDKYFEVKLSDTGIDDATEMLTLSFNGVNILDALTQIANAANDGNGCDWWVEKNVIYFGKCEKGESLDISRETNADSITRSSGENDYANRVYAFGSSENLPNYYRKNLIFTVDYASGSVFSDRTKPLEIDMFDEDVIVPITTYKIPALIAIVMTGSTESKHYLNVQGTQDLATTKLEAGKYSLFDYGEVQLDTTISEYPDSTITGKVTLDFYAQYTYNEQTLQTKIAVSEQEFSVAAATSGNTKFSIPLVLEQVKSVLPDITDLSILVKATYNFDTSYDISGLTFETAIAGITVIMEHSASFYAKINCLDWKSWSYKGQHWVKVTPAATPFIGTEIRGCTRKDDGTFSIISLAANTGDTFEFSQDDNGEDYLVKGKVPSAYFSSRYDESRGIVTSRLQLPDYALYKDAEGNISATQTTGSTKVYDAKGYIDAETGLSTEKIVESLQYFDSVKPTFENSVQQVNLRTEEEEYEDTGEKTGALIYNYVIFENLLANFKNKYSLADGNMKITFSSGLLNGLTFEIEKFKGYFDDGTYANGTSSSGTWFRIVPNEDYAVMFPNKYAYPQAGDTYNISGYDTSLISATLLPLAEIKLYEKALAWLEGRQLDQGTYTIVMMSQYTKTLMYSDPEPTGYMEYDDGTAMLFDNGRKVTLEDKTYTPDYTESSLQPYYIGRKVHIEDISKFGTAGRDTRIIGVEFKLDYPYDSPTLTCGETSAYSRLKKIEKQITKLGNV